MNDDTRYTCAVGKIRALETRLIRKERFIQMCDADSAENAVKLLLDTDYGPSLSELRTIGNFEDILKNEARNVIELISFFSNDPELTNAFRLRIDFNNLKLLLKAEHLAETEDTTEFVNRHLIEGGLVPPERLKKLLKSGSIQELPVELSFVARKAKEALKENNDPQLIDIILDSVFFSLLKKRIGGNCLFEKYLERSVDLLNIKNFLRVRQKDKGKDFLEKMFLPGGRLDEKLFLTSIDDIDDREGSLLSRSPHEYEELVSQGIKYYQENNSWKELERLSDDYAMSALSEAKWIAFGIEPLIAYLFAKEIEIKNIRMIIAGKLNRMPKELLRETLREPYV
jgi:V/A-type H+-transporting ATPase subunit C